MKRVLFVIFVQLFVVKFAFAQRGLNGNSDWKVPVPVISPQMNPNLTVNQIAVPSVPSLPSAIYTFSPSVSALNLIPSVPNTPAMPSIPNSPVPSSPGGELKMTVPRQKLLPPLPPIPPSPTVKIALN